MIGTQHAKTMAAYNKWQNTSLYSAAETLDDAARQLDRGSFFNSIHDTLNHILWGDRMWMSRFAGTPKPTQPNFAGSVQEGGAWADLTAARAAMDAEINNW
ncbi:MAG: damage-inducible protein DinB, partial [Alphaproteobacteria bacterium]|nr:damage-inducible protein DinB [Alphaproteobacteria bacterium]